MYFYNEPTQTEEISNENATPTSKPGRGRKTKIMENPDLTPRTGVIKGRPILAKTNESLRASYCVNSKKYYGEHKYIISVKRFLGRRPHLLNDPKFMENLKRMTPQQQYNALINPVIYIEPFPAN